jgi:hypothetical protein
VPLRLSLDRIEGDLAVLAAEDGASVDVPRAWLPADARPGDVLTVAFARDDDATRRLAAETRAIQAELKAADDGGDIKL